MDEQSKDQWEMVFSSPKRYQVEIMKALLEEENIPGVIVNKQDSSYIFIGEVELYVKSDDILRAKLIINRSQAIE